MEVDEYSYESYSYDDASYDELSYGYNCDNNSAVSYSSNCAKSKDSWEPYDSDDDYYETHNEIPIRHEKIPLDNTIKVVAHNSISNFIKPTDKPSSEKAFEKAITVLFNQTLEGTIATVFLNLYGRKDIVDILNSVSSYSQLEQLIPN